MLSLFFSILLLTLCANAARVSFFINLTWQYGSPDGVSRLMIFSNETYPGPRLVIDQGDFVEFTVQNSLPFPTAIHFHGISQLGTPWSDGSPGLSQKPIAPNDTFIYRWTATEYGTYFYHGHSRGQISDGLIGAILIRPKKSEPSPFSLISSDPADVSAMVKAANSPHLVLLQDWNHLTASEIDAIAAKADYDLYCTNSMLINGRGQVYCLGQDTYEQIAAPSTLFVLNGTKITDQGCSPPVPAGEGNFTHDPSALQPGVIYGCNATKGYRTKFIVNPARRFASFNFISAMSVQAPIVSIDQHPMYVYAVDGHYIEPKLVDGINIYNGERYSVMVDLTKNTPGDYTMRVSNLGFNQLISVYGLVRYSNSPSNPPASTPYYSYSAANTSASVVTLNDNILPPYPPVQPAQTADETHKLAIGRNGASYKWTLSGNASYPAAAYYQHPLLFNPQDGNNPFLTIHTTNGSWVDIILTVTPTSSTPLQPRHPIHKHGNKGFLIGYGSGPFVWETVAEAIQAQPSSFNLNNPPYRDMFATPLAVQGPVWAVIRYQSANPGVWFLHCHLQTHFGGGMAMAILDGIDDLPPIPQYYKDRGSG